MAVTTQKSAEYTIETATPLVKSNTVDKHGKLRTLYFTHDQDGAGDANSTVTLGKLPAGKVKILGGLSRFYCNWVTSSQTMDIGWKAYTDLDGDAVALDVDGLVDGLDVDTVGEKIHTTAGDTTDPGGYYYIAATMFAEGGTAGTMSFRIEYVVD